MGLKTSNDATSNTARREQSIMRTLKIGCEKIIDVARQQPKGKPSKMLMMQQAHLAYCSRPALNSLVKILELP